MSSTTAPPSAKNPIHCQLARLLKLLSGEWTATVVLALRTNGPTRYGELQRLVGGISSKVLSDRLKMLEQEGFITRTAEPTVPPKVTYQLTEQGEALDATLCELQSVVESWKA